MTLSYCSTCYLFTPKHLHISIFPYLSPSSLPHILFLPSLTTHIHKSLHSFFPVFLVLSATYFSIPRSYLSILIRTAVPIHSLLRPENIIVSVKIYIIYPHSRSIFYLIMFCRLLVQQRKLFLFNLVFLS